MKFYGIAGFALLLGAAGIGIATQSSEPQTEDNFEIAKNIEIFVNMFKELNTYYVDDIEPNRFMRKGIDAMLGTLDPYTDYIPEEELGDFKFQLTGKYEGIGAVVKKFESKYIVTDVYEGTPAQIGGLIAGDIILAIDGKTLSSTEYKDDLLKGTPGTSVAMRVIRGGQEMNITLTRGEIKIPNISYAQVLENNYAYIVLQTFTEKAGKNVAKALSDLEAKGDIKGVILDLRGNGGGLLSEAVDLVNVFVDKGMTVVETKGKIKDWDRSFKTLNKAIEMEKPLVVLIDDNTASASEIVAGAIQDLDRGVLIGRRSFGKGLVQNTRDVGYNAKVKLTTAKYYTPSGRCIQAVDYKNGIAVAISDSLRSVFKTKNGRTVFDGGGISPDMKVEIPDYGIITKALINKHFIFDFATEYAQKHKTINNAIQFALTDEEFDEFVQFAKKRKFFYETQSEAALSAMEEKAKAENYWSELSGEMAAMRKRFQEEKQNAFFKYRDEIKNLLEEEIASRYFYQKGSIEARLKEDKDLNVALNLLKDSWRYNSLLSSR